jgi:trk system potassium uptake protein TrkA
MELLGNGHQVLLIDRDPRAIHPETVPEADWLLADACEMTALTQAELERADVVVAATGDDKANLVVSFLAKTEFGVPRVVGRVNNPKNEWMFNETWGVDVAVSTPRIMTALVEEAVTVGDLVKIFSFRRTGTDLVEVTLPGDSPLSGQLLSSIRWPLDTVLVAIIRDGQPFAPGADHTLEDGDELLFVTAVGSEAKLQAMLLADD